MIAEAVCECAQGHLLIIGCAVRCGAVQYGQSVAPPAGGGGGGAGGSLEGRGSGMPAELCISSWKK